MIYGYARVSTKMQVKGNSLAEQTESLRKAGCNEVIEESYSGKTTERPQLQKLLDKLKADDTLIVTKLDRLARSAVEGGQLIKTLTDKGVKIIILNMGTFDNTPINKAMVTMLLAFAEFERDMIIERTQTGKDIAKLNPNFKEGRPLKLSKQQEEHCMELLQDKTYKQVAELMGISESTLYRIARRFKAKKVLSK